MAVAGLAAFLMFAPTHTSTTAAVVPQRQPTAAEIKHERDVKIVHDELAPRMTKATDKEVFAVSNTIVDECTRLNIDPLFILAIIENESGFDIEAVSPTGARGLMQIIPSTFKLVSDSKRMFDPVENVRAGVRYVQRLREHGFKRPETVLLAYNQGPAVAIATQGDLAVAPPEAQAFVPRVMSQYRKLLTKHGYNPKDARKLFATGEVKVVQAKPKPTSTPAPVANVKAEIVPMISPLITEQPSEMVAQVLQMPSVVQ